MKTVPLVACIALGSTVALAQTAACLSLNSTGTPRNKRSTTVAKTFAYSFTTSSPVTLRAARIHTGKPGAPMRLEIRAGGLRPGAVLAHGSWTSTAGPAWQGCNFERSVSLAGSSQYWLVWSDPGDSIMPSATSGMQTTVLGGIGSFWVSLPQEAAMFQLYCSLLDGPHTTSNGTPCAMTGGGYGSVFSNTPPHVGNQEFAVEAGGFSPGAPAVVLFQSFDARGHLRLPIPLPANPSLKGLYADLQVAGEDKSSTWVCPLVTSNRLGFTLF